jgi:hypothetical protein
MEGSRSLREKGTARAPTVTVTATVTSAATAKATLPLIRTVQQRGGGTGRNERR